MTGAVHESGLIDTTIVVQLADIDPAELPESVVISAVTLAELSARPHHTDDSAERARRVNVLQRIESTFDPLPFDAEAARCYGQIAAATHALGHTPRRATDLMVAATAMTNRLPLYTTRPDDFTGLDDLVTVVTVDRP